MSLTVYLPGTLCDERLWMPVWRELDPVNKEFVPLQWANSLDEMLKLCQFACQPGAVKLVGFSMGGYIAAQVALQVPHLISELILIGYHPQALTPQEVNYRRQWQKNLQPGSSAVISESRLNELVSPSSIHAELAKSTTRTMANDLGAGILALQLKATTERADLTQQLATAPFAVTLVAAEHDEIVAASTLQQCANEHGFNFVCIADSGHMTPLENPLAIAACLR